MTTSLFGTDGIRVRVGTEPFKLPNISHLGFAIGAWIIQKYGTGAKIIIAHDTRESNHWMLAAVQAGILLHHIEVHYAQTLPTPTVCKLLTLSDEFSCGIILSASHNPYHDNGIKIIDRMSGKLSEHDELAITHYFYQQPSYTYHSFGTMHTTATAHISYNNFVISMFRPGILTDKKIILDCAHGATYQIAPELFAHLGAEVITINTTPNGTNINDACGALHTESLQHAIKKHKAAIGFAFDGDGDRVIAVNHNGDIKNGDDMLALLSEHPLYRMQKTIVGTIMSNHGLELFLQSHGKKLIRTAVGDKYVAAYLNTHNGLLGGEQSGHIILHDYLQTGDGMVTALRILETIITTGNWAMDTFDKLPQVLINIPVVHKRDLKDADIASIIEAYEKQLDSGRVIVRYSGTENLLRVMVEDTTHDGAQTIGTNLGKALQQKLQ